jgi:hypothetical protein
MQNKAGASDYMGPRKKLRNSSPFPIVDSIGKAAVSIPLSAAEKMLNAGVAVTNAALSPTKALASMMARKKKKK